MKRLVAVVLALVAAFSVGAQQRDDFHAQVGLLACYMAPDAVYFNVPMSGDAVGPMPSWYLLFGRQQGLLMGTFVHLNASEMLYYFKGDGGSIDDWLLRPLFFNQAPTAWGGPWKQYGSSSLDIVDLDLGWSIDLRLFRLVGLAGPSLFITDNLWGGTFPGKGDDIPYEEVLDRTFRESAVLYPSDTLSIGVNIYLGIEARIAFISLNAGFRYRNALETYLLFGDSSFLQHCEVMVGGGILL